MKILYKILAIIFSITVIVSCDLDINEDPNNPSESTLELTFPAGVASSAYVIGGWYQLLGGIWAQHWTQSVGAQQYRDYDEYDIQTTTLDDRQFGELYSGSLNDLEFVKELAVEQQNWYYYFMATVMQAYTFQVLTDLYDQIPFSEALRGDEGIFTPAYNNGSEVYDSLISRINKAAIMLEEVEEITPRPGRDDVIFSGNIESWIEFANTLKLKIYLRQSFVTSRTSVVEEGITNLFSGETAFLTNSATFSTFASEINRSNPVYETEVSRFGNVNLAASNTLLNTLLGTGDPRVDAIFNTPNAGGGHIGLDQGDYSNGDYNNRLDLSQPNLSAPDPVIFISEAESYFLQAEAILRFGVSGDARAMYEAGIEASFAAFGVSGAAALYGTGGPYEYAATQAEQLNQIWLQKWIAMANYQGLEAYFEHNRTNQPDIFTVSVNSVIGDRLPRRLLFPDSERSSNPNVPAGQFFVYDPVWWDIN
jgi:hypothetical protein